MKDNEEKASKEKLGAVDKKVSRKIEVTKVDSKNGGGKDTQDFEIPNEGHSWAMRLVMFFGIAVVVVVLGLGWYLYNRPQPEPKQLVSPDTARSIEDVTEKDIARETADIIDEVDTASVINNDFEPVAPTIVFDPETEKIYVTIQTRNLTQPAQIKAEWYYVNEDTFIDEVLYGAEKGINNIAFNLERPPSGMWPEGDYEIKIFVDGELAQIARFEVKAVALDESGSLGEDDDTGTEETEVSEEETTDEETEPLP